MFQAFVPSPHDVRALVRLAVPIVAMQVGMMLMSVVDTIFVGHVSARELAAAALGGLYTIGLFNFCLGVVWAVDPLVSQALGARDPAAAALGVQRGLVLAAVMGVVATALCVPAEWVYRALREPPDVIPRAVSFVHISAPSLVPMLLFVALRQSLVAMKRTSALVVVVVLSNLLNAGLDWVLVFGHWGLPAMGAPGSALATTITRFLGLFALLVIARRALEPMLRPWRKEALALGPLLRTFQIGLPIGAQNSVEFTTFAAISVFAGWFGAEAVSGHQVAINLASLMFMVPLGIGSASSVLVGHAIGEQDMAHARRVRLRVACDGRHLPGIECGHRRIPRAFARSSPPVASAKQCQPARQLRPNGTLPRGGPAGTTGQTTESASGSERLEILVIFGSQYGNTHRIARAIARSLSSEHHVRVLPAAAASEVSGAGIDLLFVGAPTQMRGLRLLAKPFLDGLVERGFAGTRAAAFDTRMDLGPQLLESTVISNQLVEAGCRLVAKPESFLVLGLEGPLAEGEEERAESWARAVVRTVGAAV